MASDKALQIYDRIIKTTSARKLTPWTKLEDGIWMGGKPGEDGFSSFSRKEFPKTDAYLGVNEHYAQLEPGKGDELGVKASLHMPIHDRPPFPGVDWLDMAVNFICDCEAQGWSIYVHCSKGESRSGMVMSAYYMKTKKWGVERALNYLLSKRPIKPLPEWIDGLFQYASELGQKDS